MLLSKCESRLQNGKVELYSSQNTKNVKCKNFYQKLQENDQNLHLSLQLPLFKAYCCCKMTFGCARMGKFICQSSLCLRANKTKEISAFIKNWQVKRDRMRAASHGSVIHRKMKCCNNSRGRS